MKWLTAILALFLCNGLAQAELPAGLQRLIEQGEYSLAQSLMRERLARDSDLPALEQLEWRFAIERLERIKKDFNRTEADILSFIRTYLPDVKEQDLIRWEEEKALEVRVIDGQKRYFEYAAENLFRIDPYLRRVKAEKQTPAPTVLYSRTDDIAKIIAAAQKAKQTRVNPVRSRITYSLSVHADQVPAGKIIRCWLPYAMEISERQENVVLVSTLPAQRIVSANRPDLHRTIYLEQTAVAGQKTDFAVSFEMTSYAVYQPVDANKCQPLGDDPDVAVYLQERPPHIVFTPEIRALSKQIVGDETNPYSIAQKIFTWIDENIPWASAREYSTFSNISEYVLQNRHGDCGMQTLFFITLCRLNGIPTRWQSGWFIEPSDDTMHDWGEIYFAPYGWVPVDMSFGLQKSEDPAIKWFFLGGMDAYRWIINSDYSQNLYPAKICPRSETIDFQRGEAEWEGGNLYFDQWDWRFRVERID